MSGDKTKNPSFNLLVVDPGRQLAAHLHKQFDSLVKTLRAPTADTALHMLALQPCDLIVMQLRLPLFSGLDLAQQIKKIRPELALLAVCHPAAEEDAAALIRLGYPPPVLWPDDETELLRRCRELLDGEVWLRRAREVRAELKRRFGADRILSLTSAMEVVQERLKRVVASRVPVLITGESGTGKELVARMIHSTGERAKRPFITVNCAAVPEGLLESQFFGHERGAFTGAAQRTPGKFELAHTGTLFLDEIGEMSPTLQAKFLRVIEYGEFERVGGVQTLKVDVRLLTATNRNLEHMVAAGTFRADLFYRINVFPIHLPPLRERGEDIPLLAYHFLMTASLRNNRQVRAIRSEALELLRQYPWPGNIRELENAIERALLLSDGVELRTEDFPSQADWGAAQVIPPEPQSGTLAELERGAVRRAFQAAGGNIALAARRLGIARGTFYNKINEYKLEKLSLETSLSDGGASIHPWVEMEEEAVRRALKISGGAISQASRLLGIARGTLYKKIDEHGISLNDFGLVSETGAENELGS